MSMRVTFAIDPGLSGAIATLLDGDAGPLIDMPTMAVGDKTEVDSAAIARFIRGVRLDNPGAYFCATIERVRAMPPKGGRRPGAQSSMNFGES